MKHTRRIVVGLALCGTLLAFGGGRAHAQEEPSFDLQPSYLVDGGAIPFFWAPLAGSLVIDRWIDPRSTPFLFSSGEGGAESGRGGEVPGAVVSAGAAAMALAMYADGDSSRYYHLKGFGESIVTTSFLTATLKRTFGRHRPDYDGTDANEGDGHKSFPSGHASQTAAAVTYFAMYLRTHGFDRWREPGTLPWWEIAAYAGLGAIALAVPGERVYHNRHHLTDVLAGTLLGAASSIAFFLYQEHRYDKAVERIRTDAAPDDAPARLALPEAPRLPEVEGPQVSFTFAF